MSAMDKIEELSFYFNLRMNYNDILKSLAVRQGVIISKRHLIRLQKMHEYSQRQYDDVGDVIDFRPACVLIWVGQNVKPHNSFIAFFLVKNRVCWSHLEVFCVEYL